MLKYELLKIYREKTIYILSAVLVGVLLVPLFLGNTPFNYLEYYQNNFKENELTIERIKDDPTAKETVNDIREANRYLGSLIKWLKEGNPEKVVASEFNYENKNLSDMEAGKLHAGSLIDQKTKVAVLQYLKENKMKKISQDTKELGSLNYLSMIFSTPEFMMIGLIVLIFHLTYVYNLDYRKNNFSSYNSSPTSYLKIFFTKFLANILSILVNVSGVFLIVLSLISLKNGLGTGDFPIAIIRNNSEVSVISTYSYLFKVLVFLLLLVLYSCLLGLLLSILSSNFIVSLSVLTLPLLLGQYELVNTFIQPAVRPFLLLSYLDITHVILGGNGFKPITNVAITYHNGLFVVMVSIGICLLITWGLLQKMPQKLMRQKLQQ